MRRTFSVAAAIVVIVLLVGALGVYAGLIGGPGSTPTPTPSPTAAATPSAGRSPDVSPGTPTPSPTPTISLPPPSPTPVPTPFDPNIHAAGIVVPIRSADLAMSVDGVVSTVYVKTNEAVVAGELLLTLDQTKYLSDIEVATSAVRQAQASVNSATVALNQVPPGDSDQLAAAQAELALAQTNLDLAQSKLSAAQTALTLTELRSPIAGTVATLDVQPGEHVQVGEPVASIGDMTSWLVETTDVSQLDVVRILVGDRATMQFPALPSLTMGGTVESIEARGTTQNGQVNFAVTIRPDSFVPQLRWNMTVSVSIVPSS